MCNTLQTNRKIPVHELILVSPTRNFQNRPLERGYPAAILRKYLSELKFADRKTLYNKETNLHVINFYVLLHNTTRLVAWREY